METSSSTTKEISLLSNQSAAASAARSTSLWSAPLASTNSFANGPLKLTLSAYCRPENTVRLTDADPTQLIHTKYELLDPSLCRTLGHGASSTVRLAYRRSDGQPVAVKTIAKHDALGLWSKTNRWRLGARNSMSSPRDAAEMRQQAKRAPRLDEVDVLTSLKGSCPNVVHLLDVYETNQEVQLVLEYCAGGDLFDCIKRRKQLEEEPSPEAVIHGSFTESETASVAKTMLDVLDALHSRHIVHRDIKPENILLVDQDVNQLKSVKLTDFGLARLLHDENEASPKASDMEDEVSVKQRSRAYSRVGSDYYSAPEVHMGLGYDTPVDIYSLGVTLYVMLCGTPPSSTSSLFKTDDIYLSDEDSSCLISVSEESTQSSQTSSELFPSELKISPSVQDLIAKMIHPNPNERIIASEALKHEWITKHSVQEDVQMADTQMVTHVTSKLSLSSSSDNVRPRTLSFAESESFLRIGPPLPVYPPSNSPTPNSPTPILQHTVKMAKIENDWHEECTSNPEASISLTLADVCNKLAPLVEEQRLHRQKKRRHRSHSHGDKKSCLLSSRIHSGGSGDKQPEKKRGATPTKKKRVCIEMGQHPHLSPSFANNRIGWRYNTSIPPLLPQQPRSPAVTPPL